MRRQAIKTAEIRRSFVDYFRERQHKEISSSPVIPFDDPTLLFTNAGMNQFKDIFTGRKKPEFPRAVSVQKCMRAGGKHNDLENVGRTGRHHTFFEMLGNFSFGDYFKEKAIYFGWEWVTKYLKLPPEHLYATVYDDDDEAFELWAKIAPELKNGRILRFGKHENYWSMGEIGPCGPCSEIHYDRGPKYGTGPDCTVNGEGDRFVEIWNLVFMQYDQKPDGTIVPLPKPSVDTGAGLERIACILQDADSNYEIDLFLRIIEHIADITGKKYSPDGGGVSHRVIADHIRALTFCIADGGGLSNEKQGYVLRRILRRTARHGRLLEMREPFIYKLVPTLVEQMGEVYPEIREKQAHIANVIRVEEESFGRTLDTGLELFDDLARRVKAQGSTVVSGEDVFRLYDTYGFPVDMTAVMAEETGLTLDMDGYEKMMHNQQEQSRGAGNTVAGESGQIQYILKEILDSALPGDARTEFVRTGLDLDCKIVEMFEMMQGDQPMLAVIPDRTPFYVEAGGQAGDIGYIEHEQFKVRVEYLFKYNDVIVHFGPLVERKYNDFEEVTGDNAHLVVEADRRRDIMRNHTATHLLHAALRKVLGEHVQQSGSYVGPDKLRFDFSHFKPMASDEKLRVEVIVNERILNGSAVSTVEDDLENAKKAGAMAIFGEKYDSRVRVVSVDDFSKELCGGTHVDNVAEIGPFMITLETGIASGVRRIEAVTGHEASRRMLRQKAAVQEIGDIANRPAEEIVDAVRETYESLVRLQKENKKLKAERFSSGTAPVGNEIALGKLKFVPHHFGDVDKDEMAGWIDRVKSFQEPVVACATGLIDGKPTVMAASNRAAKVHVGKLLKEVLSRIDGRGGGKETFAQGSYPADLEPDEIFRIFQDKLKNE